MRFFEKERTRCKRYSTLSHEILQQWMFYLGEDLLNYRWNQSWELCNREIKKFLISKKERYFYMNEINRDWFFILFGYRENFVVPFIIEKYIIKRRNIYNISACKSKITEKITKKVVVRIVRNWNFFPSILPLIEQDNNYYFKKYKIFFYISRIISFLTYN